MLEETWLKTVIWDLCEFWGMLWGLARGIGQFSERNSVHSDVRIGIYYIH